MDRALLLVALACYLAPLLGRDGARMRVLAARWWVPAGILLHIQGLLLVVWAEGLSMGSMTEGLGFTALVLVLAREWFARRPRMALLRRILLALTCVLLAFAAFAPRSVGAGQASSPFFLLHIGLVLTGFAGFALTFSMSSLYLVVRRRLKQKRLDDLGRLPSLASLDALILRTMLFGFVTLTAGIAVGMAWSMNRTGRLLPGDVTSVLTMAVWLWYLVGLSARVAVGWRGRVVALFGVAGFVVFMLIAGLSFAVSGWHGAGS